MGRKVHKSIWFSWSVFPVQVFPLKNKYKPLRLLGPLCLDQSWIWVPTFIFWDVCFATQPIRANKVCWALDESILCLSILCFYVFMFYVFMFIYFMTTHENRHFHTCTMSYTCKENLSSWEIVNDVNFKHYILPNDICSLNERNP